MTVKFELPDKLKGNIFFARRVRRCLMEPEKDKELEKDIREWKYPKLECLLPDNGEGTE